MTPDAPAIGPRGKVQEAPRFMPTPERLSQYLERNTADVEAELTSVEGRKKILQQLKDHEADLKKTYPSFDTGNVQHELELVGTTLEKKREYLKKAQSPEKKGLFSRALSRVKSFAKKHPVVTTLLVAAAAAAAIAGGYYLAANWELLMTKAGLAKIFSGAEAAEKLMPITPPTPPLPAEGIYAVPPPAMPPGTGIL